jgi:hypothetical protein
MISDGRREATADRHRTRDLPGQSRGGDKLGDRVIVGGDLEHGVR